MKKLLAMALIALFAFAPIYAFAGGCCSGKKACTCAKCDCSAGTCTCGCCGK